MESMNTNASKRVKQPSNRTATMIALFVTLIPGLAFAGGDGSGFFCYISQYFKQIVGAAALTAIMMWAIEHIFGASKLHDVVIKVGVAAGIVIVGATFITNSGLTLSCAV